MPEGYQQSRRSVEKVNIRPQHTFFVPAEGFPLALYTGILQGSSHVEKVETSERRPFRQYYAKPCAICVRVDAERDPH